MSYLTYYEEIDEGYVAFGGNPKGGKSQAEMCDKKNSVLFNDTEYIILSLNIMLTDESQVLLRVSRKNNMYSVDLKNIVPKEGSGPNWLFDIDALTKSMNYKPVITGNQSNGNAGTKACDDADNGLSFNLEMPALEDISTFTFSSDHEDADEEDDINNMDTAIQMDVKSAFLYGKIEEEVYVCQPLGSEDPDFPDKVYKVEKALYGLHQARKAWYETLLTYLLDNGFHKRKIEKTLFIRRHKDDILLVQVYVDDIIIGSTKKGLCNAFENMMHEKF
uniref:Putative ribonuclease H-like domain-containing protein n=1 Tax=Tanacetum cinerariifolium TaxID=118510 RepID=A0A699K2Z4_TANCI|nr:putative ribonuclease H-like domain-containing protein [Tanacetum cinerariifolium]